MITSSQCDLQREADLTAVLKEMAARNTEHNSDSLVSRNYAPSHAVGEGRTDWDSY